MGFPVLACVLQERAIFNMLHFLPYLVVSMDGRNTRVWRKRLLVEENDKKKLFHTGKHMLHGLSRRLRMAVMKSQNQRQCLSIHLLDGLLKLSNLQIFIYRGLLEHLSDQNESASSSPRNIVIIGSSSDGT